MIVWRGVVSTLQWEPAERATDIIGALIDTYVRGGKIMSGFNFAYEREGILHLSFGRGKGHTTAILNYLDAHEGQEIVVISHEAAMRGVAHFDTNPRNRYYSVAEADQGLRGYVPDVIFIDLSWDDYNRNMQEIYQILSVYRCPPYGVPIISMVSDGIRTEPLRGPVQFKVETWPSRFLHLVSDYDIAPAQKKPTPAI